MKLWVFYTKLLVSNKWILKSPYKSLTGHNIILVLTTVFMFWELNILLDTIQWNNIKEKIITKITTLSDGTESSHSDSF